MKATLCSAFVCMVSLAIWGLTYARLRNDTATMGSKYFRSFRTHPRLLLVFGLLSSLAAIIGFPGKDSLQYTALLCTVWYVATYYMTCGAWMLEAAFTPALNTDPVGKLDRVFERKNQPIFKAIRCCSQFAFSFFLFLWLYQFYVELNGANR